EQFRAYRAAQSAGGRVGGFPGGGGGADFDLGDILGDIFGRAGGAGGAGFDIGEILGRQGRAAGPHRGEASTTRVQTSLKEAVTGTERTLSLHHPRRGEDTTRLTVKIPPGVQTGSKVRLAGQGAAGLRGGPPGDLYIDVEVAEHPLVRR